MNNQFLSFLLLCLITSCSDSKEGADHNLNPLKDYNRTNNDFGFHRIENDTNIGTPKNATKEDLAYFFDIKKNVKNLNQLNFFENDDSLIRRDDNESDLIAPIRWIGGVNDDHELYRAPLIKKKKFSVLVLDIPAEPSVALFYKPKGGKVDKMIEDRHAPDSVRFHQLNDTLIICQYYWAYDFGSDLSDIRTYYFIGEKTGVFKYGLTRVGTSHLNLNDFVIQDKGVLVNDNKKETTLLVRSDTLIHSGDSKKDGIFKINYIYFDNVSVE